MGFNIEPFEDGFLFLPIDSDMQAWRVTLEPYAGSDGAPTYFKVYAYPPMTKAQAEAASSRFGPGMTVNGLLSRANGSVVSGFVRQEELHCDNGPVISREMLDLLPVVIDRGTALISSDRRTGKEA